MQTLYVIFGFLGPFMVLGIIGVFYGIYINKHKEHKNG